MKIIADKIVESHLYSRTILVEDGPIVSAGDSYIEGTMYRPERVVMRWKGNDAPETVAVLGYRVNEDGTPRYAGGSKHAPEHRVVYRLSKLPDWLAETCR